MPEHNDSQRPTNLAPNPFHCLLQNDDLITSFAVRSDRLLNRANETKDTVVLVIDVIISPSRVQSRVNASFSWD